MATIAEQAREMADMAAKLHRRPITKASVDAAIKSTTLPAAVANTNPREILEDSKGPQVGPPHAEGCDCAACMRRRKDSKDAMEEGMIEVGDPTGDEGMHPTDAKASRQRHEGMRS